MVASSANSATTPSTSLRANAASMSAMTCSTATTWSSFMVASLGVSGVRCGPHAHAVMRKVAAQASAGTRRVVERLARSGVLLEELTADLARGGVEAVPQVDQPD